MEVLSTWMSDQWVWTINSQVEETEWQATVAAAGQPSNRVIYGRISSSWDYQFGIFRLP